MKNPTVIVIPPKKDNILYYVLKGGRPTDYEYHFCWLLHKLREEKTSTPRMLIFFRSLKHLNRAYEYLDTQLLSDGHFIEPGSCETMDDRTHLFEKYHMKTKDNVKQSICKLFADSNSHLRVVLCSSSFSMGLNLRNVDIVVHYGLPSDTDEFLQQTGRAGRTPDHQALSIVFAYKGCTGNLK